VETVNQGVTTTLDVIHTDNFSLILDGTPQSGQ
jgi:hypothetical protein